MRIFIVNKRVVFKFYFANRIACLSYFDRILIGVIIIVGVTRNGVPYRIFISIRKFRNGLTNHTVNGVTYGKLVISFRNNRNAATKIVTIIHVSLSRNGSYNVVCLAYVNKSMNSCAIVVVSSFYDKFKFVIANISNLNVLADNYVVKLNYYVTKVRACANIVNTRLPVINNIVFVYYLYVKYAVSCLIASYKHTSFFIVIVRRANSIVDGIRAGVNKLRNGGRILYAIYTILDSNHHLAVLLVQYAVHVNRKSMRIAIIRKYCRTRRVKLEVRRYESNRNVVYGRKVFSYV